MAGSAQPLDRGVEGESVVSILCTFPGKFGDLLWALPTLRALARRTGEAVDLLTSADMASICPLISAQPYVGRCFADPQWVRVHTDTEDRIPPADHPAARRYAHVFHCGYRGWPQRPLPFETLDCLNDQLPETIDEIADAHLQLDTPWIQDPGKVPSRAAALTAGFSDDHFELKYGLLRLLERRGYSPHVVGHASRWWQEAGRGTGGPDWIGAAWMIQHADVFLGCNSAPHVLAVACGTPVVLMEPSPARHNPIFFPLGTTGPQVTLVTGVDGKPTFDARHVVDTLTAVLARSSHATRRRQEKAPR